MENKNTKITVFLDSVGRTIIGKLAKEDETSITLASPALLIVQPNPQTNQLQLQMLPLFFREFSKPSENPITWKYNKSSIVVAENLDLADQLVQQYEQMFLNSPAAQTTTPTGEAPVVKLFDEETK